MGQQKHDCKAKTLALIAKIYLKSKSEASKETDLKFSVRVNCREWEQFV
jgi:hypothetical protein